MNKKIILFVLLFGGIFMSCRGNNSDVQNYIGGYTTKEFDEVKSGFIENFRKYGEKFRDNRRI